MPALASILVADALDAASLLKTTSATVGVSKTLTPDGLAAPGVQRWVDRSGGIQVGFPTLTWSMRKPTRESRLTRVTLKYTLPTLATTAPTTSTGIQPAPQKAYEQMIIMEGFFPERGTEAERIVAFSNFLSLLIATVTASDGAPSDSTGSPIYTGITKLEPIYGT